MKLDKD
jgi:hypothetical protein